MFTMKIRLVLILMFPVLLLSGQKSTYDALNTFLGTGFFEEFDRLREKSEEAVSDFKLLQEMENYAEEDMANIKTAYDLSAKRFNRVLLNIKKDMMKKDVRKYIANHPDGYAKQIEADFYRAKDFYANTFQEEVTTLTGGRVTGAGFLVLIPQVVGYIEKAVKVFKAVKDKFRKINEDMLDKYLIEPHRFKTWDEI